MSGVDSSIIMWSYVEDALGVCPKVPSEIDPIFGHEKSNERSC